MVGEAFGHEYRGVVVVEEKTNSWEVKVRNGLKYWVWTARDQSLGGGRRRADRRPASYTHEHPPPSASSPLDFWYIHILLDQRSHTCGVCLSYEHKIRGIAHTKQYLFSCTVGSLSCSGRMETSGV